MKWVGLLAPACYDSLAELSRRYTCESLSFRFAPAHLTTAQTSSIRQTSRQSGSHPQTSCRRASSGCAYYVLLAHRPQMIAKTEAMQAMLENITYQMTHMSYAQQADLLAGQIGLLKSLATSTNGQVVEQAVQIFGGRARASHPLRDLSSKR